MKFDKEEKKKKKKKKQREKPSSVSPAPCVEKYKKVRSMDWALRHTWDINTQTVRRNRIKYPVAIGAPKISKDQVERFNAMVCGCAPAPPLS
jgi:hypothetical protein